MEYGNLTNIDFFSKLLDRERPEWLYPLAAESFDSYSF